MKSLAERVFSLAPSATTAIDARAKQMLSAGEQVINLSVGEPSESTPDSICEAAVRSIRAKQTKYTHPSGIPELKTAICQKLKSENGLEYRPDQITVSSGAKHSVFNILLSLINPGDEVIIPAPFWVTYPQLVSLLGGRPVIVQAGMSGNFKLSPAGLEKAITPKTKLLILNSPVNPTGAVYNQSELSALADIIMHHDLYCLSDEIYEHILYDGCRHFSMASLGEGIKARTAVINGVSKAFAMPGWRIGYSAAPAPLAAAVNALQSQCTLHPANASQYAAVEAFLSGGEFTRLMTASLDKKRGITARALREIPGLRFAMPAGAFYFFLDVSAYLGKSHLGTLLGNSVDLCRWLLEFQRLAVVPGSAFGTEGYIRISFTSPEDALAEGLRRLKNGLCSLA